MEEIVKFLREVPHVQFVGCDVPVIMQRRFVDLQLVGGREYSFQLGGLGAVAGVSSAFYAFFRAPSGPLKLSARGRGQCTGTDP